jgi:hypothetical protein
MAGRREEKKRRRREEGRLKKILKSCLSFSSDI